ncbi:UNKNOWN [Stylonychia lemnae]|uniref:Uncharacterized protein n=1 Tax=Stylonychia lemnae TaxID=5949 RepID=A0A078AA87_STYLE|nr:UNKNOWN [Stylonychia lemnae]|eukprot:CDW78796.1 UNKNOWN [Stylonychia lemnae]
MDSLAEEIQLLAIIQGQIHIQNICSQQLLLFQDKKQQTNRDKFVQSPYRVNIRERLFELEDALLEIKTTTQQKEQNIQSALEKENTKVVQTVNSQIINLKQAIGTLADAVSEEIENLKRSIQSDVDIQLNQNQVKFEQLCQVFSKHENDNSKIIFEINTLKDELQTLHAIEGKNVEKFHGYMEDRLTNMKSDNKAGKNIKQQSK